MLPSNPPDDNAHREPSKPEDEGKGDNESAGMHSVPIASPSESQAHTSKWQQAKEKARYTFDNIVWFFSDPTRVLAFLTLLLVVLGFCTLWIQRDTEQRQLRAYVFLDPDHELKMTVPPSTTSTFEIDLAVRNTGLTPAYNVVGESWATLITDMPNDFIFSGPMDPRGNSSIPIPPNGVVHYHVGSARPLTEGEFNALNSGKLHIVVYGQLTYLDAFGTPRFTNICWKSEKAFGYGNIFGRCAVHNDAD